VETLINPQGTNDQNPFNEGKTSQAYSRIDPIYEQSAIEAINFVDPLKHNGAEGLVIDIGAGTGVSSEVILKTGVKNLVLVEPSEAMLEQAIKRLADKAEYCKLHAEDLNDKFNSNVDLAYALNTFHLFTDLSKFLASIACALKPGGCFVFNISTPTYGFEKLSKEEIATIKANKDFYTKLNESAPNEILIYTIALLDKIIDCDFTEVFTKDSVEQIFASVGMRLEDSTEVIIKMQADYQRNIWSMMAQSFVSDQKQIDDLVKSIELPEELHIRQAIFKLVNQS
jgi:ubiquinone/menaquinone biosynthesis C-methylase UbiE